MNKNSKTPKHCFMCGSKLESFELNVKQCKSEDCGEVFVHVADAEDKPRLLLITIDIDFENQK